MSFLNNIVNEFDIALKTLSNKKSGTGRTYPPEPAEKNTEALSPSETKRSIQMMRVNLAGEVAAQALYRGNHLYVKTLKLENILLKQEMKKLIIWYGAKNVLMNLKEVAQFLTPYGMRVLLQLVQYLEDLGKKLA